jgi:anti-sigma factor RsiW
MNHVTDEVLNEYLDDALLPAQRALAAAHLAECAVCAGRLAALETLSVRFATLTVPFLTRDLSASVLAALPQRPNAVRQRGAPPALTWVFAAQALGAVVLLALAWPMVSNLAKAWVVPGAWPDAGLGEAVTQMRAWLAMIGDPAGAVEQTWANLQTWWIEFGARAARMWPPALIGPAEAGLLVTAVAGLWLAGNVLLLRQPLSTFLRRRS